MSELTEDREGRDSLRGLLLSIGGTALLSTTFVTAKYSLGGFDPIPLSFINSLSAAGWALIIALPSVGPRRLVPPPRIVSRVLLLGSLTGVGMILAYMGLEKLDPSFASFLWRFQPVISITMGAVLLKERVSVKELGLAALMVGGGVLSTVGRWDIVGAGTMFVLLACATSATQLYIAKTISVDLPAIVLVLYRATVSGFVIGLWLLLTGNLRLSAPTSYWLVALLGAFLGPCAGYLLIFKSYHYWTLSQTSVVHTAQPLLTLSLAFLFLGQVPTPRESLGGALILAGAFGLAWVHLSRRTPR